MAAYAWVITKDHIADENAKCPSNNHAVGMIGPRHSDFWRDVKDEECAAKVRNHKWKRKFKMYDDDGELYYEGYFVDGNDEDATGLEPLDDFGTPNAGAVEIHYVDQDTGKWESIN